MVRTRIYYCILLFSLQMAVQTVHAQRQGQGKLQSAITGFNEKVLQEKLYVHTDKNFYLAGDILWFKIYYTEAMTGKRLQESKVAYVELLNEDNQPVLQAGISLRSGEDHGSFYLPVSLQSGSYRLRAYTNWMKNFDQALFFEKTIVIANTLSVTNNRVETDEQDPFILGVYPEGGNLVYGLESRVGVAVKDPRGYGVDFRGCILEDDRDTVSSFASFKFGMGLFSFTPKKGHTYTVIAITKEGRLLSKIVNGIYEKGYVMRVIKESDNNPIRILVNNSSVMNGPAGELISLAVVNRHKLVILKTAGMSSEGIARFEIEKDQLPAGISYFTVFNEEQVPVCERLFFTAVSPGVNLEIRSDNPAYGPRENVGINITSRDEKKQNRPSNLSASVYLDDSLQQDRTPGIFEYMWLTSYLSGIVESPGYYFSKEEGLEKALENLMIIQGWRRFNWDQVFQNNKKYLQYLPELGGHIITGLVTDTRTGKPVSGVTAYLSITGSPFGFYTSKSDAAGLVHFETRDYFGNEPVYVQTAAAADSFYRINIQSPFVQADAVMNRPWPLFKEKDSSELLQYSISTQVQQIFYADSFRRFSRPPVTDTLPFYGKYEMEYRLDDYKRFKTMEEVLREYVREIGVGTREGKLTLKMFSPYLHDFYEGHVMVMLDGVPLTDPDKIFDIDPLTIQKLDILQSRYILGSAAFNGIASFSTYKGEFDNHDVNPKLVAIDYEGLQLQREFYSPDYSTGALQASRLPDLRHTLFWLPDINTREDGTAAFHFFTGDRKGRYRVVVEGMNEKGEFLSSQFIFTVQ
ncbi:MAG: hypothetical protein GC171_09075 [Terrimonas sp.]|nr:hypothetical protein [Terrimonas sp.]